MSRRKTIAVFGSYRPTPGQIEYEQARELGRRLAQGGYHVMNGGYGGVMAASSQGAKEGGGKTIGVICKAFSPKANEFTDQVIVAKNLLERLETLLRRANGYVILKGGTGTLVELALCWEYVNKGLMTPKPIVISGGFWKPVVDVLGPEAGFDPRYTDPAERPDSCTDFVRVADSPEKVVLEINRWFEKQKKNQE
ncbi:MAG: LOG family protein [bacterium]